MKTFNMHVKTVILSERNKVLLLKQKRTDKRTLWDLPGSTFTEEQSFDETVITEVQKEIGYYVYPGKIIGITDYKNNKSTQLFVIMEGNILNGELILSKNYDNYAWIDLNRLKDYPLTPWLEHYIKNNKYPFKDVEIEIEELDIKNNRRREIIQEDISSSVKSNKSTNIGSNMKGSFGILKDAIMRTLHPKRAEVDQTTPKASEIYDMNEKKEQKQEEVADKLNFKFKKEPEDAKSDIIIDHTDDIIIEHEDTIPKPEKPVIKKQEPDKQIVTPISPNEKVFDMNINKEQNLKEAEKDPEITVIHKDENRPFIRKEKASKQKISFNSQKINRLNWKDKLNQINRTDANNERKSAPRPKGKR